jgi:hypothetical protein
MYNIAWALTLSENNKLKSIRYGGMREKGLRLGWKCALGAVCSHPGSCGCGRAMSWCLLDDITYEGALEYARGEREENGVPDLFKDFDREMVVTQHVSLAVGDVRMYSAFRDVNKDTKKGIHLNILTIELWRITICQPSMNA